MLLFDCFPLQQEHTRESFVTSEKKVRQLEAQLHEEQLATANGRKVYQFPLYSYMLPFVNVLGLLLSPQLMFICYRYC